jgi:hypothetical protein
MRTKNQVCTLNLTVDGESPVPFPVCPTRARLAEAYRCLRDIQLVRNHRGDPSFQKSLEQRMIWRELIDLEVQALDVSNNVEAQCADRPVGALRPD